MRLVDLVSKFKEKSALIYQASFAIFPLCLAVIPWGVLCGSLAIKAGLTPLQAQSMSLFIFAGAAQLAGVSMFGAMSPTIPILSSTFVIGSRHLLYSAVFQSYIKDLPWPRRMFFAFFLTDEMFAIATSHMDKSRSFSYLYAVAAGVIFYLVWNLATLGGIIAGSNISNIEELGLEFAIAATFIAIVIPSIKDRSTLAAVLVSGIVALILDLVGFEYSLICATALGMIAGFYTSNGEHYDT
ncbi:AzlC family ABC transporter permease [Vibrio pectenicida]|uniref:AzlC family ABC transporter permease n=1 Tax=Vibrio pectenicida TaxID=62763 RepID=A0A7Y4EDL5_9VIBR|nr:AzlC family ABC transporter permease [Vibrio pectenicida]NOH70819.1 AzlC family ABC transporter permease [Vibrio pectenicida]